MPDAILTVNAGSSSIKFALFSLPPDGPPVQIVHGTIEGLGQAPRMRATNADGAALAEQHWDGSATHADVFAHLLSWIDAHLGDARLVAVGHRVVHGGQRLTQPAPVTPELLAELDQLVELAPLHQPAALAGIRAVAQVRPDLLQVACFDTAFHRSMPEVARRFALPRTLTNPDRGQGIERYGFHGLSYEYIASVLPPDLAGGRVVVAHLGNGASLCAMRAGRSVDTTMSFTALDGLVMGTRCGSLDPGVVLYLLQARGMTADAVEDLLYHRSGLLGVSGIDSDMRALVASSDPRAAEAIDLFAFRIARETGAMAVSLGGLDGIVFTAGIGEHTPLVREKVCACLGCFGVVLDPAANARGTGRISATGPQVRVIPTDEELVIAQHTQKVRGSTPEPRQRRSL